MISNTALDSPYQLGLHHSNHLIKKISRQHLDFHTPWDKAKQHPTPQVPLFGHAVTVYGPALCLMQGAACKD